ncbi:tRNA-uridine aminocarboxypropyltransferase [Bdellovibrio sp.]|uniref:tRNA-uridine aminocarboxypropyltransferase n=1 Tax=Bdellovibrio sp. TaxID=28201 RepID=UPI0039E3B60E
MDIQTYLKNRQKMKFAEDSLRVLCSRCLQSPVTCYCSAVKKVDTNIEFVILIHPIEVRRRIATGRMAYLCLQDSHLISGEDYTHHSEVNALLTDSRYHSVILYPGEDSLNLSNLSEAERSEVSPPNKKLRVFVIDGTWATAKKMIRKSGNLSQLPRICFTPEKVSTFRVRRQPHPHCYSTIEAIHQTIELLGVSSGFDVSCRQHDQLLQVFDQMVEKQLQFVRESYAKSGKDPLSRERRKLVGV